MRCAALARVASVTLLVALASCERSTAPPVPDHVEAVSVLEQISVVGTSVFAVPTVRVRSTKGVPVQGTSVTFTVSSGGGSITGGTQITDRNGEARPEGWLLGTVAGENTVSASVDGIAGAVTFRATGLPGAPARLGMLTQPPSSAASGATLLPQPVVGLHDSFGNLTPVPGVAVTASLTQPGAELDGYIALTGSDGIARFTALRLLGPTGVYTLSFSAPGIEVATAGSGLALVEDVHGGCSTAVPLNFVLGEIRRVTLDASGGLTCLAFNLAQHAGHQFLVMFENMPTYGAYTTALFTGSLFGEPASPRDFSYTFRGAPTSNTAAQPAVLSAPTVTVPRVPEQSAHSWDFGAGTIYEIHPPDPPADAATPYVLNSLGRRINLNSTAATPQVGDTISGIWMEGIPRLGITTGAQRAVIRHVSAELIIAEDVRLTTSLTRQGGGFNTPLHPDTMRAIAEQYAAIARVQSDLLFDGRHNAAVENVNAGRVLAVHSLMYADNIWGYTYSSGSYFVWDYWVGTDGVTGGFNQRVERNVDNLFMHEVSHMREVGLLQRENVVNRRGNQWFVEGFARFSERLPIAMRLLGTPNPSRTANVVLPRNPAFNNAFFRDDVPTYLNLPTSVFGGYQHSSYIFDYLADQVALQGGDWLAALREFVIAAGRPDVLDATVRRWLGIDFPTLFTRARVALYLDDIGTPGLPAWTQYHQFQLRASRPPTTATDPRQAWQTLVPGSAVEVSYSIPAGGAWGHVIDGTQAHADAVYSLSAARTSNAVMSVTRIR
jgi:hypothetical protein